jgi:hypothetical protein
MANGSNPTVNYSTLLDRFYKRLDFLGNLIQVINGAFLTIFIAFFTASLSSNGDVKNLIVSISILFFWRIYIHLVDLEIIDIYGRIIYCEDKLGIFEDQISLKGSLIRKPKTEIIFSNRGQLYFDLLTFLIMIALYLNSVLSMNDKFPIPYQELLIVVAGIEIIVFIVFVCYITCKSKKQLSRIL